MKTRIHVDRHTVRANHKTGARDPVISVATYKGTKKAHEVTVHGPSVMVYSPDKPLSCGAAVWLETLGEVTVK